jgi:hypothetical protein
MATTPVYNWPTPDDTDLVKDGAKAIRDLGNAIDTTVSSVPTPDVGFNLTFTSSFSGAAGIVGNPFSATYDSYLMVLQISTSANNDAINLRMRSGTTSASGTDYFPINHGLTSGSVAFNTVANSQTSMALGNTLGSADGLYSLILYIHRPFIAQRTYFQGFMHGATGANVSAVQAIQGRHDASVSYDAFELLFGNNKDGVVRIYGLKN